MRNINSSYLRYGYMDSQYKWFDLTNYKDDLKIALLIISANLFIPLFFYSIYRMLRYKNILYLLEAPITLALVDTIVFSFLKDARGRALIFSNVKKLAHKIV